MCGAQNELEREGSKDILKQQKPFIQAPPYDKENGGRSHKAEVLPWQTGGGGGKQGRSMEFLPALLLVDTVVRPCAACWTIPLRCRRRSAPRCSLGWKVGGWCGVLAEESRNSGRKGVVWRKRSEGTA